MSWVINLNNFSRPHPLPLPMQSSEGVGGQRHVALIVQCSPFLQRDAFASHLRPLLLHGG